MGDFSGTALKELYDFIWKLEATKSKVVMTMSVKIDIKCITTHK